MINRNLFDLALGRCARVGAAIAASAVLAGCATSTHHAPVEDRMPRPASTASVAAAASAASSAATGAAATIAAPQAVPAPAPVASAPAADAGLARPGGENAGQPGYYAVKVGDTLVRIGLETGQNWRDIARWNNIDNPNALEVGQVLRVIPPASEAGAATTRPVAPAPRIESRPLEARPAASSSVPSAPAGAPSVPLPAPAIPAPAPSPAPAAPSAAPRDSEGDIAWGWPANGPVTIQFDDVRSKGLSIAGKAGDPVLAAADGRVVYAGSGLRGYGNLVIVKHNATYLTAYAHNQTLLVKEDQVVRRGQKIAEMGSSDTDRVQLHFEVRRLGKPVDPARVLPAR
ncbi:MAG: peptidoglycan DD-metalloendopeptidase family protein [Rubrivivax sp.]|nr:peptidoglycan DD-metalloendopeptidase family protein [Rubrivivax sp.]